MQQHIIIDGVVVNTIMATAEEARHAYPDATIVDASQGGSIGWGWDGAQLGAPPAEPEPAPEIPQEITRFQALAALDHFNLLDQVEAYMTQPDTPRIQKLAWVNALNFKRQSPTVVGISHLFGLTDAQVDALFVLGYSIEA